VAIHRKLECTARNVLPGEESAKSSCLQIGGSVLDVCCGSACWLYLEGGLSKSR
jgi:ubiquinone/menaquinone biosynthesis C-methylase UbiE